MADSGSDQGRSKVETAGAGALRRDLQLSEKPAWAKKCRL